MLLTVAVYAAASKFYTNPILPFDSPDPAVIATTERADGSGLPYFYAIVTSDDYATMPKPKPTGRFPIYKSTDLISWVSAVESSAGIWMKTSISLLVTLSRSTEDLTSLSSYSIITGICQPRLGKYLEHRLSSVVSWPDLVGT
jgi:hypothetical protein